MKTMYYLVCAWCIVSTPLAAQSVKPPPVLETRISDDFRDDKLHAKQDRAALSQARASEAAMMEGVNFGEECTTVSEPSNRLKFEHERNVNSFLSIPMKLGLGRYLIVHMSNPRLVTHGGVINSLSSNDNGWNENGSLYSLSRPWGMIGDLGQKEPKAYLFRPSPLLERQGKTVEPAKAGTNIENYPVNRFESYALSLLHKGEKLVRWERKDTMHAVGAIRAEAQCLRCHDGKVGDLLGAFTYSYAKSKAVPPDEKTKLMLKLHDEGKTLAQIAEAAGLLKEARNPADTQTIASAGHHVAFALLYQGIVPGEMVQLVDQGRKHLLDTDLGLVKKPPSPSGAE
jgi:hypothetical protein